MLGFADYSRNWIGRRGGMLGFADDLPQIRMAVSFKLSPRCEGVSFQTPGADVAFHDAGSQGPSIFELPKTARARCYLADWNHCAAV